MVRKVMLCVMVLLLASTSAWAAFPGFGKSEPAQAAADLIPIGEMTSEYDGVLKDYWANVSNPYAKSYAFALEAFGMKGDAEKLLAEMNQLGSGVTAEGIEKSTTTFGPAAAAITDKIKSAEKLTDEGKTNLLKSMGYMAGVGDIMEKVEKKEVPAGGVQLQGIPGQINHIVKLKELGQKAAESAKKASPLEAPKYVSLANGIAKLTEVIVADAETAKNTLTTYVDYAKSQKIDVPPDVTKAFEVK